MSYSVFRNISGITSVLAFAGELKVGRTNLSVYPDLPLLDLFLEINRKKCATKARTGS
jgi:hypothetical protein